MQVKQALKTFRKFKKFFRIRIRILIENNLNKNLLTVILYRLNNMSIMTR